MGVRGEAAKYRESMRIEAFKQKFHSYVYEHYLGVRTTGRVAASIPDGGHYSALPYKVILEILDRLALTNNDVFVDIGCGKGRAVCCACRLPIRRVVGIEVNQSLCNLTQRNIDRVRGRRCTFQSILGRAEEYDFLDATVIYLFNPFGQDSMARLVERLTTSYNASQRRIQIAYANCLYEQPFREAAWLRKIEEWPASKFLAFGRAVSFWESICK